MNTIMMNKREGRIPLLVSAYYRSHAHFIPVNKCTYSLSKYAYACIEMLPVYRENNR